MLYIPLQECVATLNTMNKTFSKAFLTPFICSQFTFADSSQIMTSSYIISVTTSQVIPLSVVLHLSHLPMHPLSTNQFFLVYIDYCNECLILELLGN